LIPKENNVVSFNDFRPISLCNLIYKLVSKVIANRLKPFLEKSLSPEQLGFLKGRRIQDAIATAHECIHSIKQKNLKALIMKIDLKKAFDCIDWAFLRLILHAAGFGDKFTDWILACVTSANFAVLINGEATNFFNSERGLRQGCPLSPYLFILVMESLSLLLSKSIADQKISGIKVSRFIKIFHLMFVDDILLLTKAEPSEWLVILDILQVFCTATGLSINPTKSSVHFWGVSEAELLLLKGTIPFLSLI
jgi:retron-type reverse transcriptase